MKVAVYARYSSDNQRDESIDAQLRSIKAYCENKGYTIVKIYIDEGKTATTDDRPQFLEMIRDSELQIFNLVIVHKLDRFARNRYDSAFYKRALKLNAVRVVSVLEQLDDSPESVILESVLEGMAEYFSKNLAREVMKGMKETALQCKHTGGTPPLGYDVAKDKTYKINPGEAKIVQFIFDWYSSGHSYGDIINECNLRGWKTKLNKPFGNNSLYGILKNEKYMGIYIYNRASASNNGKRNNHLSKPVSEQIRIEGGIPQIVPKDTFERVRKRMESNAKGRNKAIENYLLSGLIKCGKCGGAMVGNRKYSKGNLYVNYECSTRKRTKQCDMHSVSKIETEELVVNKIKDILFNNIDDLVEKTFRYMNENSSLLQEDKKIYEKELKKVDEKINNIIAAISDGMYNSSMKKTLTELENKKAELLISIELANQPIDIDKKDIRSFILSHTKKDDETLIRTFIEKVVVYPDTVNVHLVVDFNGGDKGIRTPGLLNAIQARSQLRHIPI